MCTINICMALCSQKEGKLNGRSLSHCKSVFFFIAFWVEPINLSILWHKIFVFLFPLSLSLSLLPFPVCLVLLKLIESVNTTAGLCCCLVAFCELTRLQFSSYFIGSFNSAHVFFAIPDRKAIFFNSHNVSKPESSSDLTSVSERFVSGAVL